MKAIKVIILVLQTIVKHFVTLGVPQCVLLTFATGVSHPYWGVEPPNPPDKSSPGLGAEPQAGYRGRAPGGRSGGQSPPEAERVLAVGRPVEAANFPHSMHF